MITVRNLDSKPVNPEPVKPNLYIGSQPVNPEAQPDIDELHRQAKLAATFGAHVSITGQWVWAGFDSIPNNEARTALKANKWIWCKNKGKWAYRGKPCHSKKNMSWEYITSKYGQEKIEEEN